MYLEDGKCAQCGKNIDQSAKFAPHNVDITQYAINKHRPYFCSPDCIQKAFDYFFNEEEIFKGTTLKRDWDNLQRNLDWSMNHWKEWLDDEGKKLDEEHKAFKRALDKLPENQGRMPGYTTLEYDRRLKDHENSTEDKKRQLNHSYANHLERETNDWYEKISSSLKSASQRSKSISASTKRSPPDRRARLHPAVRQLRRQLCQRRRYTRGPYPALLVIYSFIAYPLSAPRHFACRASLL
jgi:hypothetical protein